MLTDVPEISQKAYKNILDFSIKHGGNVLVIGPSGSGKTEIAMQAAEEAGCDLIYINLSVLERVDLQGFPSPSDDKQTVQYAAPNYLKFTDLALKEELNIICDILPEIPEDTNKNIKKYLESRYAELSKCIKKSKLESGKIIFKDSDLLKSYEKYINSININNEEKKYIFIFDEVDKAATETTQTLLEILQFHSINGRKLNIKTCILTGNMPDEHAFSNEISHAITKRCKTYKMNINFNVWKRWALDNNINESVVDFLTSNPEFLYKKAPDGDSTAYALASPRTWVYAANDIDKLNKLEGLTNKELKILQRNIISGFVGTTAAQKFITWEEYYRDLAPIGEKIIEEGWCPTVTELGAEHQIDSQQIMTLAYMVTSKAYYLLNPETPKEYLEKCIKNIYSWIGTLDSEIKLASVRASFAGDWKKAYEYKLSSIPEFAKIFTDLQEKSKKYVK